MTCYFAEIIAQTCYTYPETNQILMDKLTNSLVQPSANANEYTFSIKNFQNPPYVADMVQGLKIHSFDIISATTVL